MSSALEHETQLSNGSKPNCPVTKVQSSAFFISHLHNAAMCSTLSNKNTLSFEKSKNSLSEIEYIIKVIYWGIYWILNRSIGINTEMFCMVLESSVWKKTVTAGILEAYLGLIHDVWSGNCPLCCSISTTVLIHPSLGFNDFCKLVKNISYLWWFGNDFQNSTWHPQRSSSLRKKFLSVGKADQKQSKNSIYYDLKLFKILPILFAFLFCLFQLFVGF